MPGRTKRLIEREAQEHGLEYVLPRLLERFRAGQETYGEHNHLSPDLDRRGECLEELYDAFIYICMGLRVEEEWVDSDLLDLIAFCIKKVGGGNKNP